MTPAQLKAECEMFDAWYASLKWATNPIDAWFVWLARAEIAHPTQEETKMTHDTTKIGPIDLANFLAFEAVRCGGKWDMATRQAREESGLTKEDYTFVMRNYMELKAAVELAHKQPDEGLGVTRADFECEWTPTEKDNKLQELATRYHDETESYDRTVCTGPIVDGGIMPVTSYERGLINRNARQAFDRIAQEAAGHGISRAELWHAVGRHA